MRNTTEGNTAFACPILIGDIGGTNARFSILVDTYAEPKSFPNVETADFVSIDEAIQTAVLDRTSMQPRTAILAVAGPIDGDEIDLTNCDWVVRPNEMIANLGFEDVIVINDFEAQALGVAFLEDAHLEKIGTGEIDENASRVVLGPGTGLGVAGLVNARRTWVPVPGEGGHVDLGPRSPRDFAIFPHIETIEGRVSAEQILCGRGIVNLYRAICRTDGVEPQFVKPSDITTAALDNSNREAVETVSLFSSYLGRVAGDLALIFMARGGVFLSGGISQKVLPALREPEFRAAFEDKAPHVELMRSIPSFVVTHPRAALSGLAAYARTPTRFGVNNEGSRWRAR